MAGELTVSTQTIVDINDPVLIESTIEALTLAATTDMLFVIPLASQNRVRIFTVTRTA